LNLIWIAVVLYAAAALWLGWRAGRSAEVGEGSAGAEFWTAGRNLGPVSVGLSISAGFMSVSWSCVYAAQLFYGYGLGALWLITVPWLLALGGIYLLARRYHELPAFSQPEMVGQRFGPGARRSVAAALALVFLVWGGAEIYVAATLLAPGLGVPVPATVLGISLVVGVYATWGGFAAVVATDKLQYALVAFYVLAVAALAAVGLSTVGLSTVGLSGEGLAGRLPPGDLIAPASGRPWTDLGSPGWATILLTLIAYLPGWLFETDLWVRVQAARDVRAARRGMLLAGVNAFLFVGVLPLAIGVAALVLFPGVDGAVPPELGAEGEAIFAAVISRYASPWLAALAAVGLVAAAMSTIDTCANVMALSVAYDILELHQQQPDRRPHPLQRLLGARSVMGAAMVASCLFALGTESLWDIFYLSGGILTTAVAFPVAAVFLPRVAGRGVMGSSVGGLGGTVLFYFLETRGWLAGIEPEWLTATGLGYILWGLLAAAFGYGIGALFRGGAAGPPTSPLGANR